MKSRIKQNRAVTTHWNLVVLLALLLNWGLFGYFFETLFCSVTQGFFFIENILKNIREWKAVLHLIVGVKFPNAEVAWLPHLLVKTIEITGKVLKRKNELWKAVWAISFSGSLQRWILQTQTLIICIWNSYIQVLPWKEINIISHMYASDF